MQNGEVQVVASLAFTIALLGAGGAAMGQEATSFSVVTCDTISLARPGSGTSYIGSIDNSDYRFSAVIPNGLTAWGAGPVAPFHGFVFFLNNKGSRASCINFEIAHVDPLEDSSSVTTDPKRSKIRVGNRVGTQTSIQGLQGALSSKT